LYTTEQDVTTQLYSSFLAQYKGLKEINDTAIATEPKTEQFMSISIEEALYKAYITELGEISGI
jgi:hypothetical protein